METTRTNILTKYFHQEFQVPKMEVLNSYKAILGLVFPLHKPYPYSEHIGVSYLHFRHLKCLVKLRDKYTVYTNPPKTSKHRNWGGMNEPPFTSPEIQLLGVPLTQILTFNPRFPFKIFTFSDNLCIISRFRADYLGCPWKWSEAI